MQTLADLARHTAHFHEWDQLGRGLQVSDHLVPLEPSFRPFEGYRSFAEKIVDDGRRPTLLSRLWDLITGTAVSSQTDTLLESESSAEEVTIPDGPPAEIEILIPEGERVDSAVVIAALGTASKPVAFELVGTGGRVAIRIACDQDDLPALRAQLDAILPLAAAEPSQTLVQLWNQAEADCVEGADFVLENDCVLPLPDARKGSESLAALLGALSLAREEEIAVFQVLFTPTRSNWRSSALQAVTSPDGQPFFVDAPEITKLAEQKFSEPLFAVRVRAVTATHDRESSDRLRHAITAAVTSRTPGRNSLAPASPADLESFQYNLLLRCTNRSGMILSLSELASVARLPGPDLKTPVLIRTRMLSRLPDGVRGEGILIGEGVHGESVLPVRLPLEARLSHTYVIGASGTGKSTLLEQMILQDIEAGHGVAVLDPHGDLVDGILGRIPEHRIDDVILFDPSDPDWVVGWNILGAQSEVEKEMLASDLVAVWRRLSTSWGDQMTAVLSNAVIAFLESSVGGTLADLRLFLLDQKFRTAFLDTIRDPHVRSFWTDEFPLLVGRRPEAPILTRLDTLLRSRFVREALTEKDKPLDFRALMDGRKIFLAKLSQGAVGEENSALLGSLLVSKFHQTALTRQDAAADRREPFFMYIDEFQGMATPSMASLFSGVRKYKLALCVAHQDLYQIQSESPELLRSILSSAHTRIVFRVSEEDARQIQRGMGAFGEAELVDLERGKAICRFGKAADSFAFQTLPLTPVEANDALSHLKQVRLVSQERFGRRRAAEEKAPAPAKGPTEPPGRGGKHHKYIQSLIRKAAEQRGFEAKIEERVLEGFGHVDLALEYHGVKVACEVSISTPVAHEVDNVSKCLAAGFDYVIVVSSEEARLQRLGEELSRHLSAELRARVHLHTPATVFTVLDMIVAKAQQKRTAEAADVRGESPAASDTQSISIPTDPQAMLDVAQASAHVRRAPQTLAKLRSIGGGPPFYKIGKNVYYRRADLDAWLAARKRRNTSGHEQESH